MANLELRLECLVMRHWVIPPLNQFTLSTEELQNFGLKILQVQTMSMTLVVTLQMDLG